MAGVYAVHTCAHARGFNHDASARSFLLYFRIQVRLGHKRHCDRDNYQRWTWNSFGELVGCLLLPRDQLLPRFAVPWERLFPRLVPVLKGIAAINSHAGSRDVGIRDSRCDGGYDWGDRARMLVDSPLASFHGFYDSTGHQ